MLLLCSDTDIPMIIQRTEAVERTRANTVQHYIAENEILMEKRTALFHPLNPL